MVVAWSLWRAVTPMAMDAKPGSFERLNGYATEQDCVAAAKVARAIRNVVVGGNRLAVEEFACMPEGAAPENARFE